MTGDDSGGTYILVRAGAMVASKREGCGAGWGLGWRCLAGGEVSESAVVVGREMGDRRGRPALKGPRRALLASPLLASAQSDVTVTWVAPCSRAVGSFISRSSLAASELLIPEEGPAGSTNNVEPHTNFGPSSPAHRSGSPTSKTSKLLFSQLLDLSSPASGRNDSERARERSAAENADSPSSSSSFSR